MPTSNGVVSKMITIIFAIKYRLLLISYILVNGHEHLMYTSPSFLKYSLPVNMRNSASTLGFCGLFIDETKATVYTNSARSQMNFQVMVFYSVIVVWLIYFSQ